jgi:hypothetical protein
MRLAEGRKIAATFFDIDDGGKGLSDVAHRRCRTEGTLTPRSFAAASSAAHTTKARFPSVPLQRDR